MSKTIEPRTNRIESLVLKEKVKERRVRDGFDHTDFRPFSRFLETSRDSTPTET